MAGEKYNVNIGGTSGHVVVGDGNVVHNDFRDKRTHFGSDGTYFDAVICEHGQVKFNGTPEETRAWLMTDEVTPQWPDLNVVRGRDIQVFSVPDYVYNAR